MILLTLLCLLLNSSFALPTPNAPTGITFSVLARNANLFDTRSTWSIIWSCFSTIFACTWIAVHPNIPGPKDSQWVVLRRRVGIMACTLIVPEFVIWWAERQRTTATCLAAKEQWTSRGWTKTHGFFLIMGGFTLHNKRGKALRILEPEEFEALIETGRIERPSITEEEIQDRSKGDYLSKGIVLVQMSWFVVQCIVRGTYNLELTGLEVATLAFAALTGVTYSLWWHKPLDVRCSVPVYELWEDSENESVGSEGMTSGSLGSPVANLSSVSGPIHCEILDENKERAVAETHDAIFTESRDQQQPVDATPDPEPNFQGSNPIPSHTIPDPNFYQIHWQNFCAFVQQQQEKHGAYLRLAFRPFLHLMFVFAETLRSLSSVLITPLFEFFQTFSIVATSKIFSPSDHLRVPTFYSPTITGSDPGKSALILAVLEGIAFGGTHCIAWSNNFPSVQERLAWRISAALIFAFPLLIVAFSWLWDSFREHSTTLKEISNGFGIALMAIYIVARITLLILACTTLRALPPQAFVEIQWTTMLPHLGFRS